MYKKLFALTITSTLSVSSLIGTGIVLLNQNNNKNLVTHYNYNTSSKNVLSIEEAKENGITIRINPINGFDSLDVSNGNKLVLTTVEKPNELKTYGVALVNFESNDVLDHWEIPDEPKFVKKYKLESDKEYVTNYTTNIIPGNNANEFFVLAGISNLADALNTVYTKYDPNATTFEKVVGADTVKDNLKEAPSIKIFKLKINDNNTLELNKQAQDNEQGYYDFKYPEFDDNHKNGGLKFYTDTGVFANFRVYLDRHRMKKARMRKAYGMGYLQYLQYGQLFQVNYKNKDKDEFALINSWLSNDVSMGNLYAFYSTEKKSLAPALGVIEDFYNDALKPMIKDLGGGKPYQPIGDKLTTDYQIITKINDDNPEPAPKSDQLNKNTALALAFMYDFYAGPADLSDKHLVEYPTIGSPLNNKKEKRPYYGFVPGWFVFRPIDNYLIYGNTLSLQECDSKVEHSIWGTAIGSYWNPLEEIYYLLTTWREMPIDDHTTDRIEYIYFMQTDLFDDSACNNSVDKNNYGNFHINYRDELISIPPSLMTVKRIRYSFYYDYYKNSIKKSMFIKVIDNVTNVVAIATNSIDQIFIFKFEKTIEPTHYITNISKLELDNKNIWLNMQYNKHTDTLIAINNKEIVTFVINNYNKNNVKLHPYTISSDNIYVSINDVTSGNGEILDNINSYIKAFQLTINNGFANSKDTGDIKDLTNHFMIQTATSNNGSEIIGINTPADLGYSTTKKIEELDKDVIALSPLELSNLKIDDDTIKKFSVSNNNNNVVGYKIANVSTFNNQTGHFRVSSIIKNPTTNYSQTFGFTKIDGDPILSIAIGNSKYSIDGFGKSLGTIVFNTIQKIKESNNPCKDWSVEEIVDNFDIDSNDEKIKKLMENIFDLVVDTKASNWGKYKKEDYLIDIDHNNTSIDTNTISFSVYYYNKITKKKILINDKEGNGFKKLEGIFATKLSSQTIMWIIIGTALGIAALLALGLGIGIPMRKNAKLSHQRMDTLTAAIGNVFKKMSDIINVKKKTPFLLRDKKQTPSTLKPQSPINSNSRPIPKKPINSVEPKKPIDTSQKSN